MNVSVPVFYSRGGEEAHISAALLNNATSMQAEDQVLRGTVELTAQLIFMLN